MLRTRTGMALAIFALFVAGLILAGCGGAGAPAADKMAAAMVKAGPAMTDVAKPASGKLADVELPPDAVKAIEETGVSEASFKAGLKKMEEDKAYAEEVGKAIFAEAFKKMPKGGMPMPHP